MSRRCSVQAAVSQPKEKSMDQRLVRETFRTSRLLDFCSEKELQAQTGHEMADWPLVIVKEAHRQRARRLRGSRHRAGDRGPRRRRRHHDRRQRSGHAGDDGRVDPGLRCPRLVPRGLCLADARRPGQCAEDDRSPCRSCCRAESRGTVEIDAAGPAASYRFRRRPDPPGAGDRLPDRTGRSEERHRDSRSTGPI